MVWTFVCFAASLCVAYTLYLVCNHGLSRAARGQQASRMAVAALLVWLPAAVKGGVTYADAVPWAVALLWMVSYPLLYHLTHRRVSPDYDNYGDITFGLYLGGLLMALHVLAAPWSVTNAALGVTEFALLLPVLFMWVYYIIYGVCVDTHGILLIRETDHNEAIEFVRSFAWYVAVGILLAIVALAVGCVCVNLFLNPPFATSTHWIVAVVLSLYLPIIAWYVFLSKRGIAHRVGLWSLVRDVNEYTESNKRYLTHLQERISRLTVTRQGPAYDKPHTMLLVIGESASRDYMSAFADYPHDTTPWMRRMAADTRHTILYKHAYSCTMHTVQVLEKALTEMNQYNGKAFGESCSIIDVAHALGYKVHWYSNQGHLGAFDTQVTIIAGTSDVAKWTEQATGKVMYDESLLDFLDEVDPAANNLVILHLIGSHFNFLNRYPHDTHTFWGQKGVQDDVRNFENSLRYTDDVLQRAYTYCRERLNLKAMVYCSDHATMPDRRRTPNFNGFRNMRIPLFVWLDDEFLAKHPARAEALQAHRERYFTNDLLYELLCGVLDVKSEHYDESSSLASDQYRYERGDLLTFEGKERIADDDERFVFQ